ncbi:MAG: HAD family hydrolase [Promethearchaeota archaeon]
MIKNIIFDLGNVLLNFKPVQFLERFITDEKRIKQFSSKILENKLWLDLDRGILSIESARKQYLANYPEEEQLINMFFSQWMEMLSPIPKNVDVLKELKKNNYKLYALSNFIMEAWNYVINRYTFFGLFDGIVLSFEINFLKPEKQIFDHLLEKYSLIPEKCVFIDDVDENISQARKMKMKGIHYSEITDLREELKRIGIIF